jgi:DNA-binding Lrp family transcriptional regulator
MNLTLLQKQLLNILQTGIEPVKRPFELIAATLNISEAALFSEISLLKSLGYIRRISATIDFRALGRISVLVTGAVPIDRVEEIAAEVNKIEGVSHNYQRNHAFNLWFTLQADSEFKIYKILADLHSRTGIKFYSLPAVEIFKLDVRFDAFSNGQSMIPSSNIPAELRRAKLMMDDEQMLSILQDDVVLITEPFSSVPGLTVDEAMASLERLFNRGVVRKIAATVDYKKLGFAANAMAVYSVNESRVHQVGQELAKLHNVSHCYERKTFEGWPYNLFAMMHGPQIDALETSVRDFASHYRIAQHELLTTVREFKKEPVKFKP